MNATTDIIINVFFLDGSDGSCVVWCVDHCITYDDGQRLLCINDFCSARAIVLLRIKCVLLMMLFCLLDKSFVPFSHEFALAIRKVIRSVSHRTSNY